MKKARRVVLTLILVSGVAGSVAAFMSTPKLYLGRQGVPCEPRDPARDCVTDTRVAAFRGALVLVLAAFAFAGVTVIFKD